ncbi:MAG: sulfur carrier protein ThiS adenylyltransferase ThiF [Sedimentisphaerales bacterium]|nr:sulfur carrier protein ThiS adenylyltransferase ThiF [Sedimentisphaerales bacterium]
MESTPFAGVLFSFMASFAEKLKCYVVGIAGLGGLGSNVAIALARAGVGKLIIADFDNVEQSNLNRQQFFTEQVGKPKVDCMVENLRRINPRVEIEGHQVILAPDNIPRIFADADCIAECFDTAQAKQMIVETVLTKMSGVKIISVSGLAGYGKSNEIRTRRISPRLVLVGDGQTGIDTCKILTAARVGIAAMHQANAILELLIDEIQT